jgi:hypothetical protein
MMEYTNLNRFYWGGHKSVIETEIELLEIKLKEKRKELNKGLPHWLTIEFAGELRPITDFEITIAYFTATDYDPYQGNSTYEVINSYYITDKSSGKKIRIFPHKEKAPDYITAYDCPKELKDEYTYTLKSIRQIENTLYSLAVNKK